MDTGRLHVDVQGPAVPSAEASLDRAGSRYNRRAMRGSFRRLGYLRVPDLGVSAEALGEVRHLLDGLFGRYDELPGHLAHERSLSDDPAAVRVPEIVRCTSLEPRLLTTRVYAAITSLAEDLLGGSSTLVFDHAIYKPPGASAPTPWHQDSAYGRDTGLAVWLPLQPTGVDEGCMRFVPFSHLGGNHPHELSTTTDGTPVWYLDDGRVKAMSPVSVPVPLGAVTVHDRKMIHGAWPNVGTDLRRAWITIFSRRRRSRQMIRRLLSSRSASS